MTVSTVQEAIGLVRAACLADMSVVVSFIAANGGRLVGGKTIKEAIGHVDAATGNAPDDDMIDGTHPTEFEPALTPGD